ncbi:Lysophosphatidylcholine acyltransferase 2 [Anabarilius grahami]|uniref:Lysophosphatidylcholine acyltransferase 2 n=1 Tax=Anabarilius grahami TaxID=495550 RepID=A0A3N0XEY0_ANAGA|nr:Lysophosphatidylcholine acyltransferase 2 [Anabarilius grahami]
MPPQRVFALPRQHSLLLPAVINPFLHELNLTKADKIKCFLQGIILVPLRAIFLLLVLMVMWPVSVMITFRQSLKGAVEPMTGWRRFLHKRVMTFLGRMYFFGMGFRVVVKGKQASSVEAPILAVAPHSSFFDAIACIEAGLPSTVSRSESLEAPIFGRFLRCVQPVLVSRKDPDSRRNTILEIERRAKSGGHWPQDTVTWTWQGPKSSCFRARLLLLTLCQLYTTVEVEFLPPQVPTEMEKKCPIKFAQSVRSVMAVSLGLPVTDHTYEDCRLMIAAGELTLPMEAGLVEFTKISRKLELKWDSVKKELESFANIACSCKGGRITVEEFASFLKLPLSPVLHELFALFDRNGDGTIDFREYVIGVTVLCRPANNEEVIQTAFKLFDIDEDNCITREEFSSLIRSALGVCDLDVNSLFTEIDADGSGHITYDEFCSFALTHPEYAKLFTTYIELQRYQGLQGGEPDCDASFSYFCSASHDDDQEDSTSDKKDD